MHEGGMCGCRNIGSVGKAGGREKNKGGERAGTSVHAEAVCRRSGSKLIIVCGCDNAA